MLQTDSSGARASNAGDDFHELWALRQALFLFDKGSELVAIAVEGLRAEDEVGTPLDTWDGVDCTFYFGGDRVASANLIIIDQLKYSTANPGQPWTVPRLTHTTNKKKDNSIIGRLAKAYASLKVRRPDLAADGSLIVRLVSNQSIDSRVVRSLSSDSGSCKGKDRRPSRRCDRAALVTASGLKNSEFEAFAKSLDFSKCGSKSRFGLEERVVATISEWTDDDSRVAVDDLMRHVRKAMMPEAKGELITRQTILSWMGFSDQAALFPCPSAIKRVEPLIQRRVSRTVVDRMLSGDQRICLHGEGGCGKTTVVQEIETLLPSNSLLLLFDCFGNGRYLDSDAYRHRSKDAFLQLSNDLARLLRIPLLLSGSRDLDYPRAFKKRLDRSANIVASLNDDALLVIVVDAADNSITAARTQTPPEKSFVHEFAAIGDLPTNVRFVVTSRTGRLESLGLPSPFTKIPIPGFSRDETAAHVLGFWSEAPEIWIDDFHHLSGGNPRVQDYAIKYARAEKADLSNSLRPKGKNLDQIFREQIEYAQVKAGGDQDIRAFCSGLIALPRPVPIADLSAVTGLDENHVRDLCADLAPGVQLTNDTIAFADEDFEHFVRREGESHLVRIRGVIADRLLARRGVDAYAAAHVAASLFDAGRRQEIIELVNKEREPTSISDPVVRREVQLQRLRIAMKVCRETGNIVDAALTVLIGAEALKTDAVIRRLLSENPDLAANFARDTSSRIILRDPDEIENHGRLLFHLMAADALAGDGISVREGQRQVWAWMQRRDKSYKEQLREHPRIRPQGWPIDYQEIAAQTESMLRIAGPRAAVESLMRWTPRPIALRIASILSFKLIISGETNLLRDCITQGLVVSPWDIFLLTPLALSGENVDLQSLEAGVTRILRRGLINIDKMKDRFVNGDNGDVEYLEIILIACETFIARGGDRGRVVPVLERIADRESRRRDRLFTSQASLIDFSLRAYALLELMDGRAPALETFLVDPPEPTGAVPPGKLRESKKRDNEKKEELRNFVGPFIDIYDVRAQTLLGLITPDEFEMNLQKAMVHYHNAEYRLDHQYNAPEMRTRAALSITRLMAIQALDRSVLLKCAISVLGSRKDPSDSSCTQVFEGLALDCSLHSQILDIVTAQAKAVREMKTSAENKINVLVSFARLLLPFSRADAAVLFNDAVAVADDVNAEAIHAISLFVPLAEHSVESLDTQARRSVARNLAVVVSDAGIRAGSSDFPWEDAARALATLDVSLALAATGRWEDLGVIGRATLLPPVLETALSRRDLSSCQISALSPLLDDMPEDQVARIVDQAIVQKNCPDLSTLAEHLAREEVLRFGARQIVSEKLRALPIKDDPGFWACQLADAVAFQQAGRANRTPAPRPDDEILRTERTGTERTENQMDAVDWNTHRFVSAEGINEVIDKVLSATQTSKSFVSVSAILDRIGGMVAPGDRVSHLEALSQCGLQRAREYDFTQALSKRVYDWGDTPSVSFWCRERLLQIVADHLPGFSRWFNYQQVPLSFILEKSGAAGEQVSTALLEGMERHSDVFHVSDLYSLVGLLARYCSAQDVAQIFTRYLERLINRIPAEKRDQWDLSDIPTEPEDGMARFLFALMGNVDVRTRWRAAHSVRCLALLGNLAIIDKLFDHYHRTSESSYQDPTAPFYWLAARLWLLIAIDRIATETPSILNRQAQRILEIAIDEEFPHLLLRSFAKSAALKLLDNGILSLYGSQRHALRQSNMNRIRPKKRQDSHNPRFGGIRYEGQEDRKFQFDSMDTLPYWYSGALNIFADVGQEEFLDVAEHWIVDRWGVKENPWRWDDEPRKHRFSGRISTSHHHGSMPTLERFHTYLEWHAMFCTVGQLMQTRALAKTGSDDFDSFQRWLGRRGLSLPPLWLSDLHSPKPLEDRFWFAPTDNTDLWIDGVGNEEFLRELLLDGKEGLIVVDSSHDTRLRDLRSSAHVNTALVSAETAGALVRALQSTDEPSDYRIPPAEDELEIDDPPYKLVGWLTYDERDPGIDEGDPLHYEVGSLRCRPSNGTLTALGLTFSIGDRPIWRTKSGKVAFVYEAWGDNLGGEDDRRRSYSHAISSSGRRLLIDREALKAFLDKSGLDLIVEVEITRRNKDYDYSGYDEEEAKESHFDRILLLRGDGTIEAAEGRLGTWTIPGPRTRV